MYNNTSPITQTGEIEMTLRLICAGGLGLAMAIAGTASGHAACAAGDLDGAWTVVGTSIYDGGSDAIWCEISLTSETPSPITYGIAGSCRSQGPRDTTPAKITVRGGTFTEDAACVLGGSVKFKSPEGTFTAKILSGRIDSTDGAKTRAVAVARFQGADGFNTMLTLIFQR